MQNNGGANNLQTLCLNFYCCSHYFLKIKIQFYTNKSIKQITKSYNLQ